MEKPPSNTAVVTAAARYEPLYISTLVLMPFSQSGARLVERARRGITANTAKLGHRRWKRTSDCYGVRGRQSDARC